MLVFMTLHLFCFSVEPGTDATNEPKFLVFYTMLVNIFSMFCFNCKTEGPDVVVKRCGTMATVSRQCKVCGLRTIGLKWKYESSTGKKLLLALELGEWGGDQEHLARPVKDMFLLYIKSCLFFCCRTRARTLERNLRKAPLLLTHKKCHKERIFPKCLWCSDCIIQSTTQHLTIVNN